MAVVNKSALKSYFETGDYPTQSQFENLIDSLRHENENVPLAEVEGLTDALNGKASNAAVEAVTPILLNAGVSSYLVPAGTLIEKLLVLEPTSINFKAGTTVGGSQWIEEIPLDAGGGIITADRYFAAATTVYFSGTTGNTVIKIFKR